MVALQTVATTALGWFIAGAVMVVCVIGIGLILAVKAGEATRDRNRH
ncbi:hypothetical protein [Nocardioides terrisoli]|nr:hypothetical protein [Nocardioides marmorisolisilvae]